MGLGGGDADPNPEINVWAFSGTSHLVHLGETKPATDWERELDQLMQHRWSRSTMPSESSYTIARKQLIAENLPFIFLGTPNILAGANARVGNFHPAVLDPYTLWNADELYVRGPGLEERGSSMTGTATGRQKETPRFFTGIILRMNG